MTQEVVGLPQELKEKGLFQQGQQQLGKVGKGIGKLEEVCGRASPSRSTINLHGELTNMALGQLGGIVARFANRPSSPDVSLWLDSVLEVHSYAPSKIVGFVSFIRATSGDEFTLQYPTREVDANYALIDLYKVWGLELPEWLATWLKAEQEG